jgi:hypothetical protein
MITQQSNAYLSQQDIHSIQMGTRTNDFKITRNESKHSVNMGTRPGPNNKMMRINNENYLIDSPDIGPRKLNNKAGVTLAPLSQPPNIIGGRASMMSLKDSEEGPSGGESHPIMRVQNFKKPQLEKLKHPSGNMRMLEESQTMQPYSTPGMEGTGVNSMISMPRKRDLA